MSEKLNTNTKTGEESELLESPCSTILGSWSVELLEDGSLRVYTLQRSDAKILTEADASNSINLTTRKILSL